MKKWDAMRKWCLLASNRPAFAGAKYLRAKPAFLTCVRGKNEARRIEKN